MGKSYHPGCFRCCVCNECLDGVPFTVDVDNKIYCVNDYHSYFAPKCFCCKTDITPVEGTEETVRVVSMDKDFHVDCYICEECGMQLTDESDKRCYPYEGRLMCRACHLQKLAMQAPNSRVAEPVCATYQYMDTNIFVGRCDVNEQHVEVAKTSDDFLWIQLSMIRNDGEVNADGLTYAGLQSMILEQYGEKHYNAQEQPHLYFQVLTLTGQFEAAIEFLSRFERYRTHAVHIALAMHEIFMLGGPRNVQEPLLSVDIEDPAPLRRLNVARLVMLYVRKIEITDPAEALQYFFSLRNLTDTDGKNLFLVCVTDLAIECRDFDLLFGKMQSTGVRSRVIIDQFETINIDPAKACEMVAAGLVKKGLFEDAIKMFDLAGMEDQALNHLSILLSQVVHQSSTPGSLRERLHLMADDFARRYINAYRSDKSCR